MYREGGSGRQDDQRAHGYAAFEALIGKLGVTGDIDEPADPSGEWWFDLSEVGGPVCWRPGRGYGIFTSDGDAFGARPDEIYREADLAAKRLRQLAASQNADVGWATLRLSDVRKLLDRQQVDLAEALHKDQAAISRLEKQNDALLSTIRDYVETLGGELRLSVRFPGFEAPLDIPRKKTPRRSRVRHSAGME